MLIQINRDRVMNGTDCILFVDSYRLIARTTESSVFRKRERTWQEGLSQSAAFVRDSIQFVVL